MSNTNIDGAVYNHNQEIGTESTTDYSPSKTVDFVNVTSGSPDIALPDDAAIGYQIRISCAGGSATATSSRTIHGGGTVPDGSSAVFEKLVDGSWIARGSGGGGTGTGELLVANVAAVEALDDVGLASGMLAKPATLKQAFVLDKASTATVDNITVLSTLSGTGRWLRVLGPVPQWSSQTTWYVDATSGNDENTGLTNLLPVKTLAEITRRLRLIAMSAYTINLLTAIPSSDCLDLNPGFDSLGSASNQTATVTILGTRTAIATGTVGSAVAANPATNTQASLTAPEIAVGQVGRFITMTSGALSGMMACILSVTGTTAKLSQWRNPSSTTFATLGTAPGAGDTFEVQDCTTIASKFRFPQSSTIAWTMTNLRFTSTSDVKLEDTSTTLNACIIESDFRAINELHRAAQSNLNSCLINPTNYIGEALPVTMRFTGCGFLKQLNVANSSLANLVGCVFYGAQVRVGTGTGLGLLGQVNIASGSTLPGGQFGLAVFNSPADGVLIERGGSLAADSPVWGASNTGYGMAVSSGGQALISTGVTPTITGTSGDVLIDNPGGTAGLAVRAGEGTPAGDLTYPFSSTAITAAGAVVLDAQSLSSWTVWNATGGANFARHAFNPHTGSKIINCPAP